MEERDDYPIIPQPDTKADEFRLQNYRAMENKLLSANSDVKRLKEELASLKEENERLRQSYKYIHESRDRADKELDEANFEIFALKEVIRELIPIVERTLFATAVWEGNLEQATKDKSIIDRAKRISDNK